MEYKAYALVAVLVASVAGTIGTSYAQAGFTVSTNKTNYTPGETITVSGNVGQAGTGQPGFLIVKTPNGAAARSDPVPVAADGSFTYSFELGDRPPLGINGEYTVEFTFGGVTRTTTFNYTVGEGGWLIATLSIEDRTYRIQYMIEGGTLDDLFGDPDSATITAEITAEEGGGQLTIRLPRDIADATEDNEDIDYIIILDDVPDEEGFADDDYGDDVRTLTIDFNEDTTAIDIVGTFVVPEFGTIAAIVLAVAIVGIIVATTKYSKFSFLPKF